ncbi:MAG: bifunctional fucokinase/L-fucose-1-P-guanylyltransferase [Clostridia bacterium]|nr:bifunctional fucokinase/L-fucose-1-P-guanylyltransferase [Clostridia bacterium]
MNYKNLFLQQSYLDNYDTYAATLGENANRPVLWDYVILTASNESQAEAYRQQIAYRLKKHTLPVATHYAVLPDHEGKRIGSGGATLGVLRYIREREADFTGLRILVIHSGGDSKRVPQYSACGKLFSPVPRELPDGRRSTLFDEFIIGMSGVPARIESGMLVLSGDVLLLFNPLQIDFFGNGAAALSIKESATTGKNHGVFLRDATGNVERFLHKQTVKTLESMGAVDASGKVNIDTGAILLSSEILQDVYTLIDTDEKFNAYVNDVVRLSFYADFVYPLASGSTLKEFYNEKPEGELNEALLNARTTLWQILHKYTLKLICLSPASFLHFGTSTELLSLVTEKIGDYRFLDWSENVCSNFAGDFSAYNSYFANDVVVGKGSYIENSDLQEGAKVGAGCILSGVTLKNATVPDGVILHALKLNNGKFVVRMLNVTDNPKENVWMGQTLPVPLWEAPLFAAFDTEMEAMQATLSGVRGPYSLQSSFQQADVTQILPWSDKLNDKVCVDRFLDAIQNKVPVTELSDRDLTPRIFRYLRRIAEKSDFSLKIRIYYYLAKLTQDEELMQLCFATISNEVLQTALQSISYQSQLHIQKQEVIARLPVRVNWGGGWSDTPPYCLEHGGMVLNAAITLNGNLPIIVTIKKLDEHKIILSSTDNGAYKEFTKTADLQNCNNPHDAFALHKAALLTCGVIPSTENIALEDICSQIGGGIYLNTEVVNIPRGSGLGTSSILAAACVKGLHEFFGINLLENELYTRVLCMEQIMSTGGGWQDQVGGLAPGIKMVSSKEGIEQKILCQPLKIAESTVSELENRFCLIYTGQRRLARNLLREVVGKYIGADPVALDALYQIQRLAVLMRFELESGNLQAFCKHLSEHWSQSRRLDKGCTNTCIDQIFNSIDDLIDGKMICGAGGGGFLQVLLKKGVTKADLRERLFSVFADSGVEVYDCKFIF